MVKAGIMLSEMQFSHLEMLETVFTLISTTVFRHQIAITTGKKYRGNILELKFNSGVQSTIAQSISTVVGGSGGLLFTILLSSAKHHKWSYNPSSTLIIYTCYSLFLHKDTLEETLPLLIHARWRYQKLGYS